jgi:hypothetical protein
MTTGPTLLCLSGGDAIGFVAVSRDLNLWSICEAGSLTGEPVIKPASFFLGVENED